MIFPWNLVQKQSRTCYRVDGMGWNKDLVGWVSRLIDPTLIGWWDDVVKIMGKMVEDGWWRSPALKSWHDHPWCMEDSWGCSNHQKSGILCNNDLIIGSVPWGTIRLKLEATFSWVKCEGVPTANFSFIRDDGMMDSCSDDDGMKLLGEILPNQNEILGWFYNRMLLKTSDWVTK